MNIILSSSWGIPTLLGHHNINITNYLYLYLFTVY